jgi:hypothetical protein
VSETKRIEIDILDTLERAFPKKLVKDLCEDEVICPDCKGLGIKIRDSVFYRSENFAGSDKDNGEFLQRVNKYHNYSISECYSCYNGVARKCKFCGHIFRRNESLCDC